MKLSNLIRNPLIAAALGAVTVAVPAGALYLAGATRAVATTAATTSAATTSAATTSAATTGAATTSAAAASPATAAPAVSGPLMLPDFSTMVQRYGPAVVNISVVSKVSTSWNSQGDENSDENSDNPG